jgi:hypothetical protein
MITLKTPDLPDFRRAFWNVQRNSHRSLKDQINQRTMNVAVRAFQALPPSDVPGKRKEVKAYMDTQLAQKVVQNKTGKNRGKFRKAGRGRDQLMRKHLIVQARRKKEGLKGLYGNAMRIASGELSRVAQISQGYLKSVFIPIIVGLYGVVKFRPPASLTQYVARWPGSSGSGKVSPAKTTINPTAVISVDIELKDSQNAKVLAMYEAAIGQAIRDETSEMRSHYEKQLQRELDAATK